MKLQLNISDMDKCACNLTGPHNTVPLWPSFSFSQFSSPLCHIITFSALLLFTFFQRRMRFLRWVRKVASRRGKSCPPKCVRDWDEEGGGAVGEIRWEVRPGGLLVQKRLSREDLGSISQIQIRISSGSYNHNLAIPAQSTFGELKVVLARETGLEPGEQRLMYQGKEREDGECLHMVGVADMSKVVLLQDPASKQKKLEQLKTEREQVGACIAVDKVRAEVDGLVKEVTALEEAVWHGMEATEKEISGLTEQLMQLILRLDGIKADGVDKVQRRAQVRRIQSAVETLDQLKLVTALSGKKPSSRGMSVEVFRCAFGNLNGSARITQHWEVFN
uniref:Uncharacterized protein n=1 Tax=Kalanchoe fedtschenkoi TaxID=63787 RepID=A0A7N0VIA2_KALFE